MKLESIQVGLPRELKRDSGKLWRSGIFKEQVSGSVRISSSGLEGDSCADTEEHGGIDKAINVYPRGHFEFWKEKLGMEVEPGGFGENFTISSLTEEDVCIGDHFQIGEVRFEVSQPRQPCYKLAWKWEIKTLALEVEQTGFSGWYFRVLNEGIILAPEEIRLIERPFPEWTIAEANRVMFHRKDDLAASRALGSCSALSQSWKTVLLKRG